MDDRSKDFEDASEWKIINNPAPPDNSAVPWVISASSLVPGNYTATKLPKQPPEMSLELSWVYGYQAEKSKNNVRYTSLGEVVYHSGAWPILAIRWYRRSFGRKNVNETIAVRVLPRPLTHHTNTSLPFPFPPLT